MEDGDVLHESLVATGLDVSNAEDAIRALSKLLSDNGYVKDTFVDAALEREKVFATGLPTLPFGVALPHTDPEHVNRTGIAVGVLSKPVTFGVMGSPGESVQVRLIFLLAVHQAEKQIEMLQGFAEFLHRGQALEELSREQSADRIVARLKSEIGMEEGGK